MADHSKPLTTSTYANFVTELDARFDDLAVGLDPAYTTATNVPTNTIRYSGAATKWQRWSGSAWVDLAATYAISITGNAGTVTNGVVTTGSYSNPAWITSLAGTKISGNIAGNAGSATVLATARNINGVSFNGSANISVNLNNNVTFNNAGSGAASGVTFNGGSAITISHNTIGAAPLNGTGASGTWGINITGNAATASTALACSGNSATVTNGVYTVGDQSIAGVKTFTTSRTQVQGGTSAMWEMHLPGSHARGLYLDSAGVTRLSTTNGSGTASTALWSVDGSGNFTVPGNVQAGQFVGGGAGLSGVLRLRARQIVYTALTAHGGVITLSLPLSLFGDVTPSFVMYYATARITGQTDVRSFFMCSGTVDAQSNIVLGSSSDDTDQAGTARADAASTFVLPFDAAQKFITYLWGGELTIFVVGYQI